VRSDSESAASGRCLQKQRLTNISTGQYIFFRRGEVILDSTVLGLDPPKGGK
jgi:hypothetical protein